MKNIHVLQTDKDPIKGDLLLRHLWKGTSLECISWWRYNETTTLGDTVVYSTLNGSFVDTPSSFKTQHIYITSDETAYPYALHLKKQEVLKIKGVGENSGELYHDKGFSYPDECQKIILTTDQDLINDGVQAIDDEFLEWFVKNPSCEEIQVELKTKQLVKPYDVYNESVSYYEIIIPQGEPKQESLEEAMRQNGYYDKPSDDLWREGVEFGIKWIIENKRSVFDNADISDESKRKILNELGYSSGDY